MQNERGRFQLGEFWLSQRPNSPAWCITWFDTDSRQTRRSSTGETDFERATIELAKYFVANTGIKDERPEDIYVSFVLDRYYERHANKLASHETAKAAIAKWKEFWQEDVVSDLTIQKQEAFIAWLECRPTTRGSRNETLSRGSIARTINVGRAAFSWSYERHELKTVPFIMRYQDDARRERILSIDEMATLFNAAAELEHQWRLMLLLVATAARPTAVLDITTTGGQIDLENKRINLLPPGKQQQKKKRRPVIPIAVTLLPWLRQWLKPEALMYRSTRKSIIRLSHVITYAGNRIATARQSFDAIKQRAGITDPSVTAYTVRHTMATWLVQQRVPEWDREVFLGHKPPGSATTAKYVHLNPEYLKPAADAIDAYFVELALKVKRPLRVGSVLVSIDRGA